MDGERGPARAIRPESRQIPVTNVPPLGRSKLSVGRSGKGGYARFAAQKVFLFAAIRGGTPPPAPSGAEGAGENFELFKNYIFIFPSENMSAVTTFYAILKNENAEHCIPPKKPPAVLCSSIIIVTLQKSSL